MIFFLSFILFSLGVFFLLKSLFGKRNDGRTDNIKNRYIEIHQKKVLDDNEYNEYVEWCKEKGEIAVDKEGYDEHRMKEYLMYRKLIKFGIKGLE